MISFNHLNRSTYQRLLIFCFINFIYIVNAYAGSDGSEGAELIKSLKKGGKVILMRHLETTKSGDSLKRDPSCKNEKRVSTIGLKHGELIREWFKKHEIKISAVYASAYCRTSETAEAVFGAYIVKDFLSLAKTLSTEQVEENTASINKLINAQKGKTNNLVLITHSPNMSEFIFDKPGYGDFVVLHAEDDEIEEIGIISIR